MHNPFARPRPNPKRDRPRRTGDRVRLGSQEYHALRIEAYTRANGKCECGCGRNAYHSVSRPHPDAGEFAHDEHGARKSDELHRGRWLNWQCHERSHNAGGKPCARKAGRKMNQKEALAYWKGIICFCGWTKHPESSFCQCCTGKLPKQLQYDVQNATGADYLQAMALAEQALLSWKPTEEKVG